MHMSLACPRLARGLLAACMIWQVVPSTGTCKSINLDLARAAPYRYFTQYGPAHADQNLFQQTFFLASFLSVSLVVLLYGVIHYRSVPIEGDKWIASSFDEEG